MCGDVVSKLIHKKDKKLKSLFGDCGAAIAIEYNKKNNYKKINQSMEQMVLDQMTLFIKVVV